ncbi:hypothetical protein [Rubrimonas cliftonensis]|uniref:Phage integrase family protein n=1 Tax=Rubrimonas cliftonensis TaxID=89524 RepID=A0A1H4GB49_9RHOB|nr:hypothetical protein [Rubrimonas cliftonensis]SEB06491.1 hypothetical protein SAMN05444370_1467 [Rubrimonas cliftonensis]
MNKATVTVQEIIDQIEAGTIPYSDQNRPRVLAALRRCSKLYDNRHPAQIILCAESFRDRWGKGPVLSFPGVFKTRAAFADWRSNVRGAIDAATGATARRAALAAQHDGWAVLRAALQPHVGGPNAPIHEKALIRFDMLARMARDVGREPLEVDAPWAKATHDALKAWTDRRGFRKAIALLDRVGALDGVAGLVPAAPIRLTQPRRCEPRATRIPPAIAGPLEAWLALRARGTRLSGYTELSIDGVKPKTVKQYRTGVEWYVDGLRALDLVDLDTVAGPQDIADPALLWRLVEAEIDGRTAKELTPNTLQGYLSGAAYFLAPYAPDILAERKLMLKLPYFEGIHGMTPEIRDWCRDLIRSPDQQYAFLSTPATLFARATPLIDRWDALDFHERADAMRLAIVAAAMAITTRLPLRVSNLIGLVLGGPDQQLFLPDRRRAPARIMLPATVVKNDKAIDADLLDTSTFSPAQILRWFVKDVRPRLAAEYDIDPDADDRLFPGLTYGRYLRLFVRTMAELGLSMTPHRCRHALASILLAIDPNTIRQVAELLGDCLATVDRHYGWIDKRALITEAQKIASKALEALDRRAGIRRRAA